MSGKPGSLSTFLSGSSPAPVRRKPDSTKLSGSSHRRVCRFAPPSIFLSMKKSPKRPYPPEIHGQKPKKLMRNAATARNPAPFYEMSTGSRNSLRNCPEVPENGVPQSLRKGPQLPPKTSGSCAFRVPGYQIFALRSCPQVFPSLSPSRPRPVPPFLQICP